MIITPQIAARIAAIVLLGVLLQLSFFSELELFRTSPDVLPALVVVLGLLGGSMLGAVAGFSIGILVDSLVVGTLGASSLVLLSVGYLAGLYRERFDVTSSLVPLLLCLGLTLVAEVGYAAVALMLGVEAPVSVDVVRDILVKSIFAFFLAAPIYLAVRRALRPALIEDRHVRRRAQPRMIGA